MFSALWTVIIFVLAITILVGFHEFGHFIVAKLMGVKVLKFSIGFGKSFFSFRDKQNTEYAVAMIPLGGYVKMVDENEGFVSKADKPYAFNRQSLLKRSLIVLAGPVFNIVLAFFAFWLMFMIGVKDLAPIVGQVMPNSIASEAGLQAGDEITSINFKPIITISDAQLALADYIGEKTIISIQVKSKNNHLSTHNLNLNNWQVNPLKPELFTSLGIIPIQPPIPAIIQTVVKDSAAEQAGLKPNDKIISLNQQPIQSWQQMEIVLQNIKTKTIPITILRDQQIIKLNITPTKQVQNDSQKYLLGIYSKPITLPASYMRIQQAGFFVASVKAMHSTWNGIVLTVNTLYKMVIGQLSVQSLSGPIGIAQVAGQSASIGFSYFLQFLALISISLGILNLLPVPILDGGYLVYFLIEAIRGKPVSLNARLQGIRIGFVVLIGFMAIALANDIHRLFS